MHTPNTTAPRRRRIFGGAAVLTASALTVLGLPAVAAASSAPTASPAATSSATATSATSSPTTATNGSALQPVCPQSTTSAKAECLALRYPATKTFAGLSQTVAPNGYGPSDLQSAYALPADGGAGQTIAIVDALDDPAAESDLAVYRAQYGLPACTTANGCFQKIDQRGGTNYPLADADWAGEISLDLDMVSAVAPQAHILLVETDSADDTSLGAGVNEAVALGAKFVSNSYVEPENPQEASTLDAFYNHPGVAVVAATGDHGYGANYPATSPYVTSVGGTTLTRDPASSRGWTETVWNQGNGVYAGASGCSAYEPKPAFQTDTGCAGRTVADVSAVAADVAVYQTYGNATPGWLEFGGTSVATPVIAGVYADAGTPAPGSYPNSYPYTGNGAGLNDITTGSNGTCSPSYLCTAGAGYDGPTGLGTPDGLSAFSSGPRGTVAGTVTDASTGKPVAGATVSADGFTTHTDAQGSYSIRLPVGDDELSVTDFGYTTGGSGISVTDGGSVTADIALKPIPRQTVTGRVTDGSGHHWALYAEISIEGDPADRVWTNPATGVYQVSLPENQSYRFDVTSGVPGYDATTDEITVGDKHTKADIALTADAEQATAPGYALHVGGQTQTFDSATSAPAGWNVVNAAGTNHGWEFTDNEGRGNLTGGTGNFAIVDSDYYGGHQDSQLVSPVYDLSGAGAADLSFDTSYIGTLGETMDADVSTDGGATWSTVWSAPRSSDNDKHVSIPLTGLAGLPNVQVRFHYTASWSYYWQVDDVLVSTRTLTPTPGGLIVGTVADSATGAGLVGAAVAGPQGSSMSTTTVATPDDPDIGDGFYALFSPRAVTALSASLAGYRTVTEPACAPADQTVWIPFRLKPVS